jgi:hypothetical protein
MWRRSKVILPSTSGSLTEAAPMLKMMLWGALKDREASSRSTGLPTETT